MAERHGDDDGNFLSRWSRRKVAVKQGVPVAPEPPLPAPKAAAEVAAPVQVQRSRASEPACGPKAADTPPMPTLDDVAGLTPQSDFSRFVASNVDSRVRNAAMKKLFADPHYNAMDGLDIYIDDYNKFEPLTKANLKQLVNARALGLIDDELAEQPKPESVQLATDNAPAALNPPDENADLQLQPDDAAGQPGAEQGLARSEDPADPAHDPVPPRSA